MEQIYPLKAFFKFENNSGENIEAVIGRRDERLEKYSGEDIYELAESRITHAVFSTRNYAQDILDLLDLDWYRLFCLIEVPRTMLFSDWPYEDESAGDIDVILGNFHPNSHVPNLETVCGIQIKIRRVNSLNELKNPSGKGTSQAHATVKMGFDKTLLLHVIAKSPHNRPLGWSELWNTFGQQVDERHVRRIAGSVRKELRDSHFGYGIMCLAQAAGHDLQYSGMHNLVKSKPPVWRPWQFREEFRINRAHLHESLSKLIKKDYRGCQPYIKSYSQHK